MIAIRRPLRYLLRACRLGLAGRGGILMYHRVTELAHDPWSLAVSRAHFAEQIDLLARRAVCLSLADFLARHRAGALPRNAVTLTFDDGYADNLHQALPLLDRFGVPATLFATSGFIGSEVETWWDRLEQAIFRVEPLPSTVEITIGRHPIIWSSGQSGDAEASQTRLHTMVYKALAELDTPRREEALGRLWDVLGGAPLYRTTHRLLTRDELVRLAEHPLITIGAHTRTHPHLAKLGEARQREELAGGKAELEALIGRPVDLVAFPHGSYDATTLRQARAAGFTAAFNSESRPVPRAGDPLRLPRITIGDDDGDRFAKWLAWSGVRLRSRARAGITSTGMRVVG